MQLPPIPAHPIVPQGPMSCAQAFEIANQFNRDIDWLTTPWHILAVLTVFFLGIVGVFLFLRTLFDIAHMLYGMARRLYGPRVELDHKEVF